MKKKRRKHVIFFQPKNENNTVRLVIWKLAYQVIIRAWIKQQHVKLVISHFREIKSYFISPLVNVQYFLKIFFFFFFIQNLVKFSTDFCSKSSVTKESYLKLHYYYLLSVDKPVRFNFFLFCKRKILIFVQLRTTLLQRLF